jgi:ketopantoate reductase
MKILIIGAGSIGVYLGVKLYSSGNNVTILGRDKLRKVHDTIIIEDRSYKVPKKIFSLPEKGEFDYIFITSKLYDLEDNLRLVSRSKIKFKAIISIQNGIVDQSVYKKYLDKLKYCTISVFEGYRLVENQLLIYKSQTGWKTEDSSLGNKIAVLLQEAGINCQSEPMLEKIKAEKTIMNCSMKYFQQ